MRRFIITSPKLNGSIELLFGADNRLSTIDFSSCTLTDQQYSHFLFSMLYNVDEVELIGAKLPATIIEGDFEVTFEMFWKKYNKKINKLRCIHLWAKADKTKQVKAYFGITAYDKFLKQESWRSKADPETYLRNEYWENEYK